MSKRFKHYAGDVSDVFQLPPRCAWVRVTDFDPLSIVTRFTQTAALSFFAPTALNIVQMEPAAVRLGERDYVPIYSHSIFRPRYTHQDVNSYFLTVELRGNIEVEAGESSDVDPGPLRFGQVSSNFEFAFLPGNSGNPCDLPLPKNIKSISFLFERTDAHLLTALKVQKAYTQIPGSAGINGAPNLKGFFSSWEPGAAWTGLRDISVGGVGTQVRQTANWKFPNLQKNFVWSGSAVSVELNLLDSGNASDDVANQVYNRVFSPSLGLEFTASDDSGAGNVDPVVVRGHVVCAY